MSASTSQRRLGVITGSGAGADDLVPEAERIAVDVVSSDRGRLTSVSVFVTDEIAVVSRHGLDRHRLPHLVDHAANLRALIAAGCDTVLALGSTGTLRSDWGVGTMVVPDDVFAPWANPSLVDDGRAHVVPSFDPVWRRRLLDSWRASTPTPIIDGGVYVQTRGPRFESRAEIRFYATVGDLVGMTLVNELVLAQQAGLAYAAVCTVDNVANGLGTAPLSIQEFESGVADNRSLLLADVRATLVRLTGAVAGEGAD